MNQLNCLSVRSAKGTRCRLSRPAYAQGVPNDVPNFYSFFYPLMSFAGRVILPLTVAFNAGNAGLRMKMPSRSLCALLLTGMLALVLAGCGGGNGNGNGNGNGGGGGSPATQNPLAASNIQTAVSGNNITVSWTNPNLENITGFNIVWVNVGDDADDGTEEFNPPEADVTAGAKDNTYLIPDLTYDATYEITVAVLYRNGTSVDSDPVQGKTEMDPTITPPGNGGGGGNGGTSNPRAVSSVQTAVSRNNITVSWTNPDQDNIDGFNLAWFNVDDDADDGTEELGSDEADVAAGASDNSYTIPDLAYDTTYEITVAVLYADQDPIPSDPVQSTTRLSVDIDGDDDGVVNTEDVDYDGDGLIEIHNLDELALLRDDLNGDGADDNENNAIVVESVGCPAAGEGGCVGYELSRSLNFSDANSYAEGSNNQSAWTDGNGWTPIGSCSSSTDCAAYTEIFEGNNHNIVGLLIARSTTIGVGLFAALNGTIRNLRLSDASVTGRENTGLLVGNANNGNLENILVSGIVSSSSSNAGALAGSARNAMVSQVIVKDSKITGTSDTGGLIGTGTDATISRSYMTDSNIIGTAANTGGLAANANDITVVQSYVTGSSISSIASDVGGLIGFGARAIIRHSYVADMNLKITGSTRIGGLIGFGNLSNISYSYVVGGSVSGSSGTDVGGLIGFGTSGVDASYWNTTATTDQTVDGESKTKEELRTPTTFAGSIYEVWGNFVCDPNTGDVMESSDGSIPANSRFTEYVWNLGNSTQFPVLNCVVGGLEPQGRAPQGRAP